MSELLGPDAYVDDVLAALTPLPATDVPVAAAHGLVLAQDVTAALPVPPWTNSAMDGYAVRARDTAPAAPRAPVVLPVSGDVPAGSVPAPLVPGTAQRIMTGAVLPEGADAVIRVEDTDQESGPRPLPAEVEVRAAARAGLNVRRAGEDVGVGDRVLAAGALLSATAVSSLASVGLASVRAVPRPRVAVVSTGAELVDPGRPLPAGAVPDSNSVLLAGLIAEHGASLASVSRSGDTAESLAGALVRAARGADLVVTSGGISAGAFDPLIMLADDGASDGPVRLHPAKVAMQPGKPQGHGAVRVEDDGTQREVPIIALPGNPVSVLVSFTTIVAPALARLAGHDAAGPGPGRAGDSPGRREPPLHARAAAAWRTPPGRRQYIPVRFVDAPTPASAGAPTRGADPGAEPRWVEPTHRLGSGSHLVASLSAAEALAVVGEHVPEVALGDPVGLIALSAPAAPGGASRPTAPSRPPTRTGP
ncbi:gephyrin-like molybdotransferase Glp [Actinomyces gerencseriae]|uniref:molybdopterin molybdotransferase MoeA n=1 Tax=Actinomyces gerencseriae TaxID=52769 RepID=UPI0023F40C9E|nr:gephyrin-like molybdotransferase Glp [Actinomyces gerencseriae]